MENIATQTLQIFSVPHAIVFEVSCHHVSYYHHYKWLGYKANCARKRRWRADILFLTVSVSDIGVGLIRVPLSGLFAACGTFVKCSELILFLILAADFFPSFFHTVTMVIAVDRLLVTKKKYNYNKLGKTRRLKIIVAFCFVSIIRYTFLSGYCSIYHRRYLAYFLILRLCTSVIFPLILIAAYVHILFYVHKRSVAASHFKVSGKNNNKRLSKTIMLTLVSQVTVKPVYDDHLEDEVSAVVIGRWSL